jgi:phosphoribosylformimino-5-aminoimidazole carboxamide ribotide isomerase
MEIIPVLDLKGGRVVHARQGQRETYGPIVSRLCPTSSPQDVLAGLLQVYSFATIYVADLDAIERKGDHSDAISELARAHPRIEFWIDNATAAPIPHDNMRHVLGSESITPSKAIATLTDKRAILSLDFRGADFLGPPDLLARPSLWPERVIIMMLARVGSSDGPDLERLALIKQHAGAARRVYAAGGVRGRADLDALQNAGAAGVLVASALHDGRLTSADLIDFD